jgi:hypothetical protein
MADRDGTPRGILATLLAELDPGGAGDSKERNVSPERVARERAAAMVSLRFERKPDIGRVEIVWRQSTEGDGRCKMRKKKLVKA